jgi:uncharacterized repeat protein (TIGR03803 family)
MRNSQKSRRWMSSTRSRSVIATLASAVVCATASIATPSAHAQTYTVLYSFQGAPQDGGVSQGKLVLDRLGNLYGTTWSGGSNSLGTLFELDPSGNETVLYTFTGAAGDGASPQGQIVRSGGNIYGTTTYGGGGGCPIAGGCGTVFEVNSGKATVLHSFAGAEGNYPSGGLVRDPSGNLYGTTTYGCYGTAQQGCRGGNGSGTVFRISQGQETVLYSFTGMRDGGNPQGALVLDRSGNLYGVTEFGGAFGHGTVFELSPNSDGTWKERVLHSFFGGPGNGAEPFAGLVMDVKGSLYGTTAFGGTITSSCQLGCGVVFKLKQNSGHWTERLLYRFAGPPGDGQFPAGSLVRDKQGHLYGITNQGGSSGEGIVFEVDALGQEQVLHTFTGGPAEGAFPFSGLTMDTSGNLYGTTQAGGGAAACDPYGCGTVFKITP